MNLKKITLKDYRCFKSLEIDFHPQLTVIIGDNGNGKTSILDAIAIGISPFIGAFDQGKKKDIHVDDVRMTIDSIGQIAFNHPSRIELQGDIEGQDQTWARVRKSQKGRSTIDEAKNIIAYGKRLGPFGQVHGFAQLPVMRYYGVCRLCKEIKAAVPKQSPRKYAERSAGYIDCLESGSTFDVFQDWFIATTHAVFQYE
jgi:predicted ATP-binding protein involved in virulence